MVFNQKTRDLIKQVGIINHPSHDWWVYQLASGAGGIVFYDPHPQVLYRQHKGALVGGNTSFLARMERVSMVFKGRFRNWSNQNIEILCAAKPLLTHGSIETLELFKKMRNAPLKDRFRLMEVAGLYRQTWRGTVSLVLAALFKKI